MCPQCILQPPQKSLRKFYFAVWILFGFACFISACEADEEEETTPAMVDVENQLDLQKTDTSSLVVFNLPQDPEGGVNFSRDLVGLIEDPTFGKTKAITYAEVRPPSDGLFLGDTFNIDSARMFIALNQSSPFSGKAGEEVKFSLFQIDEPLNPGAVYSIDAQIDYSASPWGQFTGTIDSNTNLISFPLNSDFIQHMEGISLNEQGDLRLFADFFRGIALVPEDESGNIILHTQLVDGNSGIDIFYQDSFEVRLNVTESSIRVGTFQHDFSGTVLEELMSSAENQEKVYLKSLGGVKANVRFPHLNSFFEQPGDKILVNKAELILPVIKNEGLSRIALIGNNENNRNVPLNQVIPREEQPFNVVQYNTTEQEFRVDVTRVMQSKFNSIADGKAPQLEGVSFFIFLDDGQNPVAARNIVLSNKRGEESVKLSLQYSIIRQ